MLFLVLVLPLSGIGQNSKSDDLKTYNTTIRKQYVASEHDARLKSKLHDVLAPIAIGDSRHRDLSILGFERRDQRLYRLLNNYVALNIPYDLGDYCGEGPDGKFDQGPLTSMDILNCTTLVESALALSKVTLDDYENETWFENVFLPELIHIKYRGGSVQRANRNDYVSAQWFPHQIATGLLADVTLPAINTLLSWDAADSGDECNPKSKNIDLAQFFANKQSEDLQVYGDVKDPEALLAQYRNLCSNIPPLPAEMYFIPRTILLQADENRFYEALFELANTDVLVGNVIRGDSRDGKQLTVIVSHQFFILRNPDNANDPYMIHAKYNDAVISQSFQAYVKYVNDWKNAVVLGFHFSRLSQPESSEVSK